MDEEGDFKSEEGGVELRNVAMTGGEVDEFSLRHGSGNCAEEEEVIGDTVFVHVGGQPRHHLMSFVLHKTVMTKDVLV